MNTKSIFAMTIAIAILSILTLPAMAYPQSYPNNDQPCVCDHWSEAQCPGYYDEFTSAAINAPYYTTNDYWYADCIFRAAYGGAYTFYPTNNMDQNPMKCDLYFGGIPHPENPDTSLLTHSTYYKTARTYPVSITWNGATYNYYTTRDWNPIRVSMQPLNTTYAQCQQWFYNQDTLGPWFCGIKWAYCYTS